MLALLVLDREETRVLENRPLPPLNADGEVELLKSENVSLRALQKLGPEIPPEFAPEPGFISNSIRTVSGAVSNLMSATIAGFFIAIG